MLKKVITTMIAVMILSLVPITAQATDSEVSTSSSRAQQEEMYAELIANGVPDEQAQNLVEKFQMEIPWDATLPNVTPAEIRQSDEGAYSKVTEIYPDGSLLVTTVEKPVENKQRSVSGCSVSVGSGYRNFRACNVKSSVVAIYFASFKADYTLVQGAIDSINSVWQGGCGSYSNLVTVSCGSPSIIRAKEGYDGRPALAQMRLDYRAKGGAGTTAYLNLNVGKDKATGGN